MGCFTRCDKNYTTVAPNYMLKNSKRILLVSKTCKEYRNKNKIIPPKRALMDIKKYSIITQRP